MSTESPLYEAARELGLHLTKGPWPMEIGGELDGCRVTVSFTPARGDWDDQEPASIGFTVEPPPMSAHHPTLSVRPRSIQRRWPRSFASADPDWDRRFVVKTEERDAAYLFLTTERRAVFDDTSRTVGTVGNVRYNSRAGFTLGRRGDLSSDHVVYIVHRLVEYANAIATGKLGGSPERG